MASLHSVEEICQGMVFFEPVLRVLYESLLESRLVVVVKLSRRAPCKSPF